MPHDTTSKIQPTSVQVRGTAKPGASRTYVSRLGRCKAWIPTAKIRCGYPTHARDAVAGRPAHAECSHRAIGQTSFRRSLLRPNPLDRLTLAHRRPAELRRNDEECGLSRLFRRAARKTGTARRPTYFESQTPGGCGGAQRPRRSSTFRGIAALDPGHPQRKTPSRDRTYLSKGRGLCLAVCVLRPAR